MKNCLFLFQIVVASVWLSACVNTRHLVVYQLKSLQKLDTIVDKTDTNQILILPVFQNEFVDGSFLLVNNSSRQIRLDLERSQFIQNGQPSSYYSGISYSKSEGELKQSVFEPTSRNIGLLDLLVGNTNTRQQVTVLTETKSEEKYTFLAPKTSRLVKGRFPFHKMVKVPRRPGLKTYMPDSTPLEVRYFISYQVDNEHLNTTKELRFYLSERSTVKISAGEYVKTLNDLEAKGWQEGMPVPTIGTYRLPRYSFYRLADYYKSGQFRSVSDPD